MSTLDTHGGWAGILGTLAAGNDVSAEVTRAVLGTILAGEATDAQIAAFIVALRQKGETVDELTGLQGAMIDAATALDVPDGTIDIVGVGGAAHRRSHALNVSTMASFVAAAAGATVCKHGNRKASSTSGAFDLLELLDIDIDIAPEVLAAQVREHGLGFAFARTFHPAMRHVGPVRAELGIPTVFNILGPLSHPGKLTRQVIGVADWAMAERMLGVFAATGSIRTLIVHGDGGLDELSTTGPSKILSLDNGEIAEMTVDPQALGFAPATADDLIGGDAAANAAIAHRVFAGEAGPKRDIVVLNAAAGLVAAGLADDLARGVEAAAAAIDDGGAAAKLAAIAAS
jgi:anthranilate phosphoribosyltransferase